MSEIPSISTDGRYVAFLSDSSNLVPDGTGVGDIFVHDRVTGKTDCVSVASDGTHGNAGSRGASISAGGLHVAFHSGSTNLVYGDSNGFQDVFVHDREGVEESTIGGRVTEINRNPVPAVTISTGSDISTTTGFDGDYCIPA
jgi:hypothetical protein